MKKSLYTILACVLFILISGCAAKYVLVQSNSPDAVSCLTDSKADAVAVADIRENFFYSVRDSIYINCIGRFFYNYDKSLQKLDKSCWIALLGEPHYQDSIGLGYFVKKISYHNTPKILLLQYFTFKNGKWDTVTFRGLKNNETVTKKIKDVFEKNKKNKPLAYIKPSTIKLDKKQYSEYDLCPFSKNDLAHNIYFNKKSKNYVVSEEGFRQFYRVPECALTFTYGEIYSLLGKPQHEIKDTFFYKMSYPPFYETSLYQKNENSTRSFFYIRCHKIAKTGFYSLYRVGLKEIIN